MSGFCSAAKVGVFCDGVSHSTEKRKDGEVKVLQINARIQPFDAKLATTIDARVRQALFKLGDAEAHAHLRRVDFTATIGGEARQLLQVFATPDTTKASIALDQVRVAGVAARTGAFTGYALTFKLIFGPCSARELEYVEDWRNGQRFITFAAADKNADLDLAPGDEDDEDEDDGSQPTLPVAEFDTDGTGKPIEAAAPASADVQDASAPEGPEPANRPLLQHKPRKPRPGKAIH